MRSIVLLAVLGLGLVHTALAQCPLSPTTPAPQSANIFSPAQENILGGILAQQQGAFTLRVLEDKTLSEPMAGVGSRLLQSGGQPMEVQFFVSDLPVLNAWSLPGRVYVTRKMIAFLRSEDELAALLAHELGHLRAHQAAVKVTSQLHEVLGVDKVGDRDDIFNRYQQLLDSWRKNPKAFQRSASELKEQEVADDLGLQMLARAGYRAEAFTEMFDHLAGTEGKTGNWFTDLFGVTSSNQRRLRDMVKVVQSLPPECIQAKPANSPAFQQWQARVELFRGSGRVASLHSVLFQRKLVPPLRDDLSYVRFSPDGHYILAQDSGNIYVFTRQPFQAVFRIDAPGAHQPWFTPDSSGIVFRFASDRVETWDIASRRRTSVHEVVVTKPCMTSQLSPDGKVLVCTGWGDTLAILDVANNTVRWEHGKWEAQQAPTRSSDFLELLRQLVELLSMHAEFSPDGHYLAAGNLDYQLVLDLNQMAPIPLSGAMKTALRQPFAFMGNDRVATMNRSDPTHSTVVRFPSGETLAHITLGRQTLTGTTRGDVLLLRPVENFPVGLMDAAHNKGLFALPTTEVDVYDDVYVHQQVSGKLSLYSLAAHTPIAETDLPPGMLGPVISADLSADERLLAVSEQHRSAIFDLASAQRVAYLLGFSSGKLLPDSLLARFPAHQSVLPTVVRLGLPNGDPARVLLEEKDRNVTTDVLGHYLLRHTVVPSNPPGSGKVTHEVLEVSAPQQSLWRREFPEQEQPGIRIDDGNATLALLWNARFKPAREELNANPDLKARLGPGASDENNSFVEFIDLRTGKPRAAILVDTQKGAFRILGWEVSGDWLLVQDNMNRTLVYAADGKNNPRARIFGHRLAASPATHLLAIENDPGHVEIYDVQTGAKQDELVLPVAIAIARFSSNGRRLVVLTRDQTAYGFDVEKAAGETAAAKPDTPNPQ